MLPGGNDARRHPRFPLASSTVELRRAEDDALVLVLPATDVSLGGLHVRHMGHNVGVDVGARLRVRLFEGDDRPRLDVTARVVRHSTTGLAFIWERENEPDVAALVASLKG